jgi:hypothetical protein
MNFKEIWKNRNQIMEGIKNSVIRNEFVEFVFNQRFDICKVCDDLDTVGKSCAVAGTHPCCKECGCSLGYKLRALSSSCPKNKWESVVTVEDEEKLDKMN